MSELTCLELSVALWLLHVLVQATVGNVELPFGYLFTSRDKPKSSAFTISIFAAGGLVAPLAALTFMVTLPHLNRHYQSRL